MAIISSDSFQHGTGLLNLATNVDWSGSIGGPGLFVEAFNTGYGPVTGKNYTAWAFPNGKIFPNDQYSRAVVSAVGPDGTDCLPSLCVRADTGGGQNTYLALIGRNTNAGAHYAHEIWKIVNGVSTFLFVDHTLPYTVGDIKELRVQGGGRLTLWNNNVFIGAASASDLASGSAGVALDTGGLATQGGTYNNDWQAGSVSDPVVASDNFSRADGALGSNWQTVVGTPQIKSDLLAGAAGDNFAYWKGAGSFGTGDQWAQITISSTLGASDFVGLMVRGGGTSAATATGYIAFINNGTASVVKVTNNGVTYSFTTLASHGGISVSNGDVLRFEVHAWGLPTKTQTLIFWKNDVLLTPTPFVNDTTYTSGGLPGVYIGNANARASNWSAGTFSFDPQASPFGQDMYTGSGMSLSGNVLFDLNDGGFPILESSSGPTIA